MIIKPLVALSLACGLTLSAFAGSAERLKKALEEGPRWTPAVQNGYQVVAYRLVKAKLVNPR